MLTVNSESEPHFKLDIRSEPIQEEDSDAKSALSNVANTLRAVSISLSTYPPIFCSCAYSKHSKWLHHASPLRIGDGEM